jgi:hypothetical protein
LSLLSGKELARILKKMTYERNSRFFKSYRIKNT